MQHHPTEIRLRRSAAHLRVTFDDDSSFDLPFEYLRVYSPSAEVKGHGPGQEVLQVGKHAVGIERIEPVGNYAVRLVFDDGHDSGLYSWDVLYDLGQNYARKWQDYLERLSAAGHKHGEPA
ncbi:MAG: DUF971 domain-containing protein [Gammaproteobacteria bacterium]|nr:DUF971 domain-containing protein [Gammaproteobacteria bacterium]